MTSAIRPTEGAQITVLVTVDGHPATHVAHAGRVTASTLIVPRRGVEDRAWTLDPQGQADVLFVHSGRLFRWPMRVEEVLPTSYYLVSVQDPSDGERREFVRAQAEVDVRLSLHGQPRGHFHHAAVELSASGLRLATDFAATEGDLVDVALRMDEHAEERAAGIRALARVVRVLQPPTGRELAMEFVELGSSDEDRLLQLVFRLREQALFLRIGKRGYH